MESSLGSAMSVDDSPSLYFFFFNDTATTEIYTLSLHDALPISRGCCGETQRPRPMPPGRRDRKSTRLNSSHPSISYAVFCLKKKKHNNKRMEKNKNNINEKKKQRQTKEI